MTTIVYRSGVLASDSMCSDEEYGIKVHSQKLWKVEDCLVGTAKGSYAGLVFIEWFKGNLADDCMWDLDVGDDFEAIVIHPDKSVITYNRYLVPENHGKPKFFAIGSGSKCAYIALEMGASAERAVKESIKYDLWSGGEIQIITF